ncbi:MAG TPA: hypothetical protein ENK18_05960 [Deltaproteobacteria bacterium]|nr:hypothetical protein [Deltaproteobacteria bacterium]
MDRLCLVLSFAWIVACEPSAPCERYVDYMCDCHDGETGIVCSELEATYLGAEADVQDECAVLLDEQQQEDNSNDTTCGTF